MSAIQLLEQLGANASLQTEEAKRALLALIEKNEIHGQKNEKMWCMMFPEDEQGEDDDKDKDKDKDENEKNGNKPDISAH